jgi:hypothetical protein
MPDDDQTADAPVLLEDGASSRTTEPELLEDGANASTVVESVADEQRRAKWLRIAKRRAILDNLLSKLDDVIYAHLAALYYME